MPTGGSMLGAGLLTRASCRKAAHRISRELKSGTVWVRLHNFVFPCAPSVGYKVVNGGVGRSPMGRIGRIGRIRPIGRAHPVEPLTHWPIGGWPCWLARSHAR